MLLNVLGEHYIIHLSKHYSVYVPCVVIAVYIVRYILSYYSTCRMLGGSPIVNYMYSVFNTN